MEMTSHVALDILGPLAAFTPCENAVADIHQATPVPILRNDWQRSPVNPQSRINSLTPKARPTWRMDGVDVDGRRFYAVPAFVGAGLTFAGITGWCGMAKLLALMPWNRQSAASA